MHTNIAVNNKNKKPHFSSLNFIFIYVIENLEKKHTAYNTHGIFSENLSFTAVKYL